MDSLLATAGLIFLAALGIYITLIICTRVAGLRSFSKLSSFDFAITVAIGSIIATVVVSSDPPIFTAVVGLVSIYVLQIGVSVLRRYFDFVAGTVDNQPLLLMAGKEVIDENLRRAKVTRADINAKLREANVIDYDEIYAVVMESTGDVSVLHGDPDGKPLDHGLLDGVRGTERMREV